MQSTIDWQRFTKIVRSASKILLTIHQRPDGDCVGSALAMRQILLRLGKEVRIVAPHKTPPTLAFLDPHGYITALENMTEEDKRYMQTVDIFFVLDTSSWAQLGDMATPFRESTAQKIVLDHHVKGDDIGAEKFIDSTAEATGALVVQAADALGVPITAEIAQSAFAALSTDTGWFRFSNVTPETFRTAARLTEAGVQPDAMYRELYEQESLGRIRLIGRTLSKTETHLDGQFMLTWILLEDFDAAGARSSDSEDIINMLLQVRGSKMAVLISELKDKSFKVSFRSRCAVDCSVLAARFGGGGHKKAAGATFASPFEQVKQTLIEAVTNALREATLCVVTADNQTQ
jgi:phosphoesterase RecJ-like protein